MSARRPPPRWRFARPDPHKGAGLYWAIFSGRLSERRSTARPSSFHHSQFVTSGEVFSGRLFLISRSTRPYSVRGGAAPRRCGPSSQPRRRRRRWVERGREAHAATIQSSCCSWPTGAWRTVPLGSASCEDTYFRALRYPGASAFPRLWPAGAQDQLCGEVTPLLERCRAADCGDQRGGVGWNRIVIASLLLVADFRYQRASLPQSRIERISETVADIGDADDGDRNRNARPQH